MTIRIGNMNLVIFSFFLTILTLPSFATVDMKNANYTDSWTDFTAPGSGYLLRILRSYSSRSLYDGLWGFGMCSDHETSVRPTPEGNLRVTECGGGVSINFMAKDFDPSKYSKTVSMLMKEVQKRN